MLDELVNLPMNQNKELKGGSLHFSSLATPQNKGHSISSPPFVDFLKPFFSFNLGRKTNPPFLKSKDFAGFKIVFCFFLWFVVVT